MKVLAIIAMLAVELVGGWLAQSYILPRIGLHALTFGQMCVAMLIIGAVQVIVTVLSAVTDA